MERIQQTTFCRFEYVIDCLHDGQETEWQFNVNTQMSIVMQTELEHSIMVHQMDAIADLHLQCHCSRACCKATRNAPHVHEYLCYCLYVDAFSTRTMAAFTKHHPQANI